MFSLESMESYIGIGYCVEKKMDFTRGLGCREDMEHYRDLF